MGKEKIALIGVGIAAAIAAVVIWLKTRGNGNGAEPQEGDTKCEGYDLYMYTNGSWQLTEANSPTCGWTPGGAEFTLSNLQIVPGSCKVGERVTVDVDVENIGNAVGTKVVVMEIT